jgi:hypothetical protein
VHLTIVGRIFRPRSSKKNIESNGKKEQIEALLSDNLKKRVEIKLEVQAPAQQQINSEDNKRA